MDVFGCANAEVARAVRFAGQAGRSESRITNHESRCGCQADEHANGFQVFKHAVPENTSVFCRDGSHTDTDFRTVCNRCNAVCFFV